VTRLDICVVALHIYVGSERSVSTSEIVDCLYRTGWRRGWSASFGGTNHWCRGLPNAAATDAPTSTAVIWPITTNDFRSATYRH